VDDEAISAALEEWDKDGDGLISANDLRTACRESGEEWTDQQVPPRGPASADMAGAWLWVVLSVLAGQCYDIFGPRSRSGQRHDLFQEA
jgi:hypothetical protein